MGQQQRDDHEHHSSDQSTQHMQDFQSLEHKVEELHNNNISDCTHRQQLFEDELLEQIQNQADELISLQVRLDLFEETFNSAMTSQCSANVNVEELTEIVVQEMGDVKRELEKYGIQTAERQRGLQEFKAEVDVESSQHPEEVSAKLVNNEGLECQEQFKVHVKSVSDILNPKILECQELKTNTKAVGLQEPPSFRQLIAPSVRAMKCLVPGSPMRFQENVRSVRTAGPVQIIRGTMLPQATTTQNAAVCPHQGIVTDMEVSPGVRTRESPMPSPITTQNGAVCPHQGIVTDRDVSPGVRTREAPMTTQNATVCPHQGVVTDRDVSPGVRTRESTMNVAAPASVKPFGFPRRKHVMPPRHCTPRRVPPGRVPSGSSRPGSASVTPGTAVSGRSLSAVPALITPPTIHTTSSDQGGVLNLIEAVL